MAPLSQELEPPANPGRFTKPDDIPIEQPVRFELVLNQKAAKALGLIIPDKLLATVDKVID